VCAGGAESHSGDRFLETTRESTLFNPFVVGGALRDQDGYGFFGREDVFLFVKRSLDSVQRVPVILYGHRRIGKSSVLRQLAYKLSPDLLCVYHDLQSSTNDSLDEALYGLAREIADKLGAARPDPADTTAETFETKFLQQVVNYIGDPRRLVLLLDEFDAVDQRKDNPTVAAKSFIPFLGRLISSGLNVGLVLVLGRRTNELSDSFKSSLLKDSVQMRIGRLTGPQTADMICTLAGSRLLFGPVATKRVIDLAAGHPYCSQVLCYAAWNRCVDRQAEVSVADVDSAISDAIDFGASGMTWIYDGLQLAEQRLFLSTLSETTDPLMGRASSLDAIQNFLRDHRLSLGQADLDSAARDLGAWDIVTGNSGIGYRFVVPLLGAWVRRERPVFQLEQEVQFANPRAWTFYELARQSEQRGDLDAAILDYHNALLTNPVFLEAQRRLATALQRRGKPGDLLAAIEGWERVLELDATAPRVELLDTLLLALEKTQKTARIVWLFQKIANADNKGQAKDRAVRIIQERASGRMSIGSRLAVSSAAELFDLIKDTENSNIAKDLQKRQKRLNNISVLTYLCSVGAAVGLAFVPISAQLGNLSIFLCALGALGMSWDTRFQIDGRLSLRKIDFLALALGVIGGEIVWRLSGSLFWGGFTAMIAANVVAAVSTPTFPMVPDEDLLAPVKVSGGPLFSIMDFAARKTSQIRDRLAKPSRETKEERT
jgi:tetratricopeptide (TPR) repeat protein